MINEAEVQSMDASMVSALRSLSRWPDWAIRGLSGEVAKQVLDYKKQHTCKCCGGVLSCTGANEDAHPEDTSAENTPQEPG